MSTDTQTEASGQKPNSPALVLTALCGLALAWWAKMLVGTAQLAWHQGVTWDTSLVAAYDRVPVVLVTVEFLVILGGCLIPLVVSLRTVPSVPRWAWWVWALCIGYVLFMCVNYLVRVQPAPLAYAKGTARLLGWLAIAVLFARRRRTHG